LIQFGCLKDLPLPLKAMVRLYRSLMPEACSSLDDCSLEDLKLLQSQQQLIVLPSFAVVSLRRDIHPQDCVSMLGAYEQGARRRL
jgi:hypothetical protein